MMLLIAVHITPSKKVYQVGDSFRLNITATNTSDRDLLIKKDWKEQLVFYHIHPTTGEQIEWPGKVLIATWMDSTDVVRLEPNQSYTVNRYVRTWIPEDVCHVPVPAQTGRNQRLRPQVRHVARHRLVQPDNTDGQTQTLAGRGAAAVNLQSTIWNR